MAESGSKYVLRPFTAKDIDQYLSWWVDKPDTLPRIGLVSGDMKAVGFLALTDCDFSIITFWMANPDNRGRESYCALREVLSGLISISLFHKKNRVFCYTHNRGMKSILKRMGFQDFDGHLIGNFNG